MTFQDLLYKLQWEYIEATLMTLYPDQEGNAQKYLGVYHELTDLSPDKSDFMIGIAVEEDEDDGTKWIDVFGIDLTNPDCKDTYALEFIPWSQWLGMEIDTKVFDEFTEYQVAASCMWEMTYLGFTEEEVLAAAEALLESHNQTRVEEGLEEIDEEDEEWEDI